MPEMISEGIVRSFHDEMKKLGIGRGIIFASSTFSKKAITFAETRPIDLMDKHKLQAILKGIKNPTLKPS